MKVLVIHPAGSFGGASKSIIEFQNQMRGSAVEADFLCMSGSVVTQFNSNGYPATSISHIAQFDNTRFGCYRGVRWLILLRELFFAPTSFKTIKKIVSQKQYDLIHINEITLVPWVLLIRRWTSAPIVVHVRSLQCENFNSFRSRWINGILKFNVDKVIAIDESVRRTLPGRLSVEIIHNSLHVVGGKKNEPVRRRRFRVAIVGVLLKLKGIYEFLEAARELVNDRGHDIEFYIVGENSRKLSGLKAEVLKRLDLAHDVRKDVEDFVIRHSLQDHVVLTGFLENVQSIYADIDILCFPSHLNAAGRPVFEAAFFGVPSIVAVKDPPPDTIIDGETGICIDEPDGRLLADAIERLFNNRDELEYLGANAQELAKKNFSIEKNSQALLQVYRDLVSENN